MGNAETWCAENGSNPRADSDRNLLRLPALARTFPDPCTRSISHQLVSTPHQGDDQSGGRPSHVLSISHPLDLEPWFGTAFGPPTPPMCLKMRRWRLGEGRRSDPPHRHTPSDSPRIDPMTPSQKRSPRATPYPDGVRFCDHNRPKSHHKPRLATIDHFQTLYRTANDIRNDYITDTVSRV